MAYSFQTFTAGHVLTAAQMNQAEVNVRDHVHGAAGVGSAPGIAKAYALFTPAGVVTKASNVSSVTDVGAGSWTVNFTTAFASSTSYNGVCACDGAAGTNLAAIIGGITRTASASSVQTINSGNTANVDPASGYLNVAYFGDQ